jgi:hypothetical protein
VASEEPVLVQQLQLEVQPRKFTICQCKFRSTETPEQLREKYATQLQQMKDMGFTDEDTNLEMLKQ